MMRLCVKRKCELCKKKFTTDAVINKTICDKCRAKNLNPDYSHAILALASVIL